MLASISIENFRCIERATVHFDGRGTGIVGANGSGKTSFLEAIYFLAHGRSFRTMTRARMLGPQASDFRLSAQIENRGLPLAGGVEFSAEGLRVRLAGEELGGISALSRELPVQIIDPSVHRLIEEGSARRRRLLDWGVFHVKHDFLVPWRRYQRTLQQRNAALKTGAGSRELAVWSRELERSAEAIDAFRAAYMEQLLPVFGQVSSELLAEPAELSYERGWDQHLNLAQALGASSSREARLKTTVVGPHRADVEFRIQGRLARERVSRGQQKMLAIALVLAQVVLRGRTPSGAAETCLLLDDPAAELDVDNLGKLLRLLETVPAQLVITSLSEDGFRGIRIGRMFHVEQGNFSPML